MAQPISSPFLAGRAAAFARPGSALERAGAGVPAAMVVAGEAGVGNRAEAGAHRLRLTA